MRRKKNRSRLLPFGAGLAAGYLLTIGVAAAGALVMWLTGADSSMALIFGTVQGILLPVKAALCIGFAAAGGVSGVNSPEK